jgi:glycosyltransferase involved in cell wall biosynthesis
MNIWINTAFDSLPGEAGRPLRYRQLAAALVRRGHAVVLWSSDWHHVKKTQRGLPLVYRQEGVDVRLVPTLPYYSNIRWSRWKSHARYARDWARLAAEAVGSGALQKPDCLIMAMPPLGVFQVAERLTKGWGTRLLVDVQDLWPETFHRLVPRVLRPLGPLIFALAHRRAQRAYQRADGVASVSEAYQEVIRRNDLRVFPLAMNLPAACERNVRGEGPLRLVYIGNLGSLYAIDVLLEAVLRLAEQGLQITLDIAGDGPGRGLVEAYARKTAAIVFHGYLAEIALDGLLRACDVGVVPMRQDSGVAVPNKVVDYAMYGLCILNGLAGKTQELLKTHDAGVFYHVDSVASLMAAIELLKRDPDEVAKRGRHARQMAEARFDGQRVYGEMAAWVEGVSNPSPGGEADPTPRQGAAVPGPAEGVLCKPPPGRGTT